MTCVPQAAKEYLATVTHNQERGGGFHVLTLNFPASFPIPHGGAFLMLSVGSEPEILLRRPMAFYDVQKKSKGVKVEILYALVGTGTSKLASIKPGTSLAALGPIGNGFSQPKRNEKVAVVAGWVGIAPFLLWGRELPPQSKKTARVLLGFRNSSQLSIAKDFGKIRIRPKTAIEGSGGDFRGTVVDLLLKELKSDSIDRILTCGPPKMIEKVCEIASNQKIPCEVSLEAKMACGLGVCLSCVTDFVKGNRPGGYTLVCQDGPVFNVEK